MISWWQLPATIVAAAGAGELVGVDDIAPPLGVGTAVAGIPDRRPNGVVLDLGVAWYGHGDAAERLLTDSPPVVTERARRVPGASPYRYLDLGCGHDGDG